MIRRADALAVLRGVGTLLLVPVGMGLVTAALCLLLGEPGSAPGFLVTAGAGGLLVLLSRLAPPLPGGLRLAHGMLVAALGWLLLPLLGCVPFLWVAGWTAEASDTLAAFRSPVNALFEAYSGFTGTGLTMAEDASALPHSLQWWRSFLQWIGGVGVIVLLVAVLRTSVAAVHLYHSEAREEKILPTIRSTARTIWWIYALYTVVGVLLLAACGLPWWTAVNHGMCGLATGGFVVTGDGTVGSGAAVRLVTLPLMLAGAVAFAVHYDVLARRRWRALADAQGRTLLVLLAVGAAVIGLHSAASGRADPLDAVFTWTSALTTTGFQATGLAGWDPGAKLLLCGGMLVGGAAGSTAGGVKLMRIFLLARGLRWRGQRLTASRREVPGYRIDGQGLSEGRAFEMVEAAGVLLGLWVLMLFVGTYVLLLALPPGTALEDALFEVVSAQSNVGLSSGLTGPDLPVTAKGILVAHMWLGRLELVPVAVLLGAATRATR